MSKLLKEKLIGENFVRLFEIEENKFRVTSVAFCSNSKNYETAEIRFNDKVFELENTFETFEEMDMGKVPSKEKQIENLKNNGIYIKPDEDKYLEFLKKKIAIAKDYGFQIEDSDLPDILKPHQKDVVRWNVIGGRRGNFLSFGLGKTLIQLCTLQIILKYNEGKALIVCPLGVRQEFKNDAKNLLGIDVTYVKTLAECKAAPMGSILITNYERVRDGDIDPNYFIATSLDEASVLRGYGTKTYQSFLTLFGKVKFKFVNTATPAPNKYKELIHYAGYLGIMDTGQSLTRFFKRDSTKANKLTLHPHKEKEFWLWLSTWGIFIQKPSDLNPTYSDEGYDLPELEYIFHEIPVDHNTAGFDLDGQSKMFRDAALGLQDSAREKRESIESRVNKSYEIIQQDPDNNYILWHDLELERVAINKKLGNGFDVYGSQDMEVREQRIFDFAFGNQKYLSTKASIAGQGCNLQRFCHNSIFVGITYKFNDFIQAVHRIYRFLQEHKCKIHIISTESEREILKELLRKQREHYKLVGNMVKLVKENGLNNNNTAEKLIRTMGIERKFIESEWYKVANNDCYEETKLIESNSLGLILTSIPFANHYEYTPSYNDFGHTTNNQEFWDQMDFLTPELHRTLQPGRIAAIHVKDRILFSSMTEFSFPTVSPFHMECGAHFIKHGFGFLGMITIETDVVRENNQTYRLGWSEKCKDGSKMGVGSPEYLMFFRKQPTTYDNAYSDIPVLKSKDGKDFVCSCGHHGKLKSFTLSNDNESVICPQCGELKKISELWNLPMFTRGMWQIDARSKWNSSGDRFLTPDELKNLDLSQVQKMFAGYFESNIYDYEKHVKTANDLDNIGRLPATFESLRLKARNWFLWDDVNRMITLNSQQSSKKMKMHLCPLQFDICDRVIDGFSNKGEIVYDPFGGLFTVPYRAIKKGRKGRAAELNPDYFSDGLVYMRAVESEITMPSLFDLDSLLKTSK